MTRAPARPGILLLGAGGQLGGELARALPALGGFRALRKEDLDITDEARTRDAIRALAPGAIVNAAAYTRVDDAESEPARAFAVNAAAPRVLAEEAARAGALLVHYSTEYVFDGTQRRPYRETDAPNPLGAYGASKLAGEEAVAAVGGAHLILRTSWLYGADSGFVAVVRRQACRERQMRFVDDQFGSPTWIRRLADATAAILRRLAEPGRLRIPEDVGGLYHLAGEGGTSRYELAQTILALDRTDETGRDVSIEPISTREYPMPARRPAFGVLDSAVARERLGVRIGPWREGLEEALGSLPPARMPNRQERQEGLDGPIQDR